MTDSEKEAEARVLAGYHQCAMEMIEARHASEPALDLAMAVIALLGKFHETRGDNERLAQGFEAPATALRVAELEGQLEEMTRREKQWRENSLAISSERARASVSAFSDFCEGHKAAYRQMGRER